MPESAALFQGGGEKCGLAALKEAIASRPPPFERLDYLLKVKIEAVLGPRKGECWGVGQDKTLRDCANLMSQRGVTAVFVKENERIAGLVTRGHILAALESGNLDSPAVAAMVKHADCIGLKLTDTVRIALDLFEAHRVKRLVVRDTKNACVGLLTSGYLLRWLGTKLKELHSISS
jgi:predicted transcriptional regulator